MIIKSLKYLNSLPIRLSLKHYQTFGEASSQLKNNELNSAESWDVLRENHPQFSISSDRAKWLQACNAEIKKDGQDGGLLQRAKEISTLLSDQGITHIFSVGVGGGGLEYQLKKINPNWYIVCSEFAVQSVALLKKVFIEADEIIEFDILKGDWKDINNKYLKSNGACLMYRVDVSFSNEQWCDIFKKLFAANIQSIVFIPSSFLTIRSIFNRKWRELKWYFSGKPVIFSGHLRTKKVFESFWQDLYKGTELNFGGTKGFYLTLNKK